MKIKQIKACLKNEGRCYVYNKKVLTKRFTFVDMDSRQKTQKASLCNPLSKHHNIVYQSLLDESKSSYAMQSLIPGMSFPVRGMQSSRFAWSMISCNIYYQNRIHSSMQPRLSCFAVLMENAYA